MKNRLFIKSAMLATLICVVTIAVPISTGIGYVNLGDSIVLLTSWLLPPLYSFLAAGIGSALSDVFLSFVPYAPITFVIKGLMATVSYFVLKALRGKKLFARIISGILAELLMILGYLVFEGVLYGFQTALINSAFNAVQGTVGVLFGVLLAGVFDKYKIFNK